MTPEEMLKYKNWAVVGVSNKEDSFGNRIYKKLKGHSYKVYPVSHKKGEIDGETVYDNLREINEKIDVVDFAVNPSVGIRILDTIIELGIDKIWLQPGTRSPEILEKAKINGIEVVQSCVLVELK